MSTSLKLKLAALFLFASAQASAITIHTNQTAFNAALGGDLLVDNLDTATETAPASPTTNIISSTTHLTTITSDANEIFRLGTSTTNIGIQASSVWTATFTFSQAITAFGFESFDFFEVSASQSLTFTTSAGESGTLLAPGFIIGNANTQYLGFSDALNFTSVSITGGFSRDGSEIDTIGYALAAVPSPAPILLLSLGLIGLLSRSRLKANA